ncbi:MAG TPA: hypothetical protein VGO07_05565 [Candidatus Saccharimonadales bacterium]|jgi:hypothetical protein|nr:hypothetical protein [Candidatus Saccharimonadales bacterium]
MSSEVITVQEASLPLSEQVDAAVVAMPAQVENSAGITSLGPHWTEVDDRELRRYEILTETGGWSPEPARAATGIGEVAAPQTVAANAGLQHRDWTPKGREEHLTGAQRTRMYLQEQLGLPMTRSARERSGQ